jgi:4-hydroxy-3-polyprenylbenzoate decarboxylase
MAARGDGVSVRDLREFLREIERIGELRRVRAPVDAHLEITEICQRIVSREGPALLFENVTGASFPLVINLFGSPRRIELAFGRPPAEIGEWLCRFAKDLERPALATILRRAKDLAKLRGMKPRVRPGGPVRDVAEDPDLTRLPILTCWPEDGGPFLTFPLVFTRSPRDGSVNVGIYRMQRFGPDETGMHFQIGKGGGYHHFEAEDENADLPLAVALGGDPLLMIAAMMPLPEGMSEAAFVGLLRGRPLELSRGATVPLDTPAGAEFVLEGVVPMGARRIEGPFGDHFGHYSAASPFPVFRVKRLFRRRDAIYPAIVVGKPPQEDGFMGNAIQDVLGPLIRLFHPEVRGIWSYEETGFHHLLVASVEERFAKEALRSAFGLLGQGQLGLTKVLVLVGRDVDPRDLDRVLEAIAGHFDPYEDFLLLPKVPFDTLDFTSFTLNVGSKMVLDATPGELAPRAPVAIPDLTAIDGRIVGQTLLGTSFLVIAVRGDAREILANVLSRLPGAQGGPEGGAPAPPKIVVAVSPDVPLENRTLLLWGIFTRFDPARDVFFEESKLRGAWALHRGRMAIDATFKPGYPAVLEMDPEIVKKVTRRWKQYEIG